MENNPIYSKGDLDYYSSSIKENQSKTLLGRHLKTLGNKLNYYVQNLFDIRGLHSLDRSTLGKLGINPEDLKQSPHVIKYIKRETLQRLLNVYINEIIDQAALYNEEKEILKNLIVSTLQKNANATEFNQTIQAIRKAAEAYPQLNWAINPTLDKLEESTNLRRTLVIPTVQLLANIRARILFLIAQRNTLTLPLSTVSIFFGIP